MKNQRNKGDVPDRGRRAFVDVMATQVREARKANSLTQQELALLAGVGRRFISELENGKQSLRLGETIEVLAVLGFELKLCLRSGGDA